MKQILILFLVIGHIVNAQSVSSAEYFFDTDPGVGNGTILSVNGNSGQLVQSYSIATTGLSEGFHSLFVRTKNADGNWSLYDRKTIYIKDFDSTSDVVSAEYFIDSDPGIGNGTSVNISSQTQIIDVDTNGLAEGDHLFYIRVQNQNGDWSFYDSSVFNLSGNLAVENSLYNSTNIFPNPFVSNLTLDLSDNSIIELIEVYDFNGRTVFHSNDDLRELYLNHFTSGVYILKIKSEDQYASFKIIKQ